MLRRTCTLLAMTCLASPPAWALDITVDTVIDHGTVQQVADPITIGDGTTNPVTLTVRNPGTVVEASNNSGRFVFVGGDDSGRLVIENGARVGQLSFSGSRRTQMRVAQEGGTGEVIVDGAGSRLEAQSFELANEGGDGTLRVLDGGVVRLNSTLFAARNDSTATIVVSGAGSRIDGSISMLSGAGNTQSARVEAGGYLGSITANGASDLVVTGAGSVVDAVTVFTTTGSVVVEEGASIDAALTVRQGSATFRTGASIAGAFQTKIIRDGAADAVVALEAGTSAVTDILSLLGSHATGGLFDVSAGAVAYLGSGTTPPAGIPAGTVHVGSDGEIFVLGAGGRIAGDVVSEGALSLAGRNAGDPRLRVNEGSVLSISGDLDLLAGSDLLVAIQGSADHDVIEVGGDAVLDGLLTLGVGEELLETVGLGDTFTMMTSESTLQGVFSNLANGAEVQYDFASGFVRLSVNYGASSAYALEDLVLAVTAFQYNGVPEPPVASLLVAGALLLRTVRRSRFA